MVGLLLVGLICLVLGLVLPSTAWLIASLIASVGAGYVLFRARTLISGAHAVEAGAAATGVLEREPSEPQPARRTRAQSRSEARAKRAESVPASEDALEQMSGAETQIIDLSDVQTGASDAPVTDTAVTDTAVIDPVPHESPTAEPDGPDLRHDGTEVSGGELLAEMGGDVASVGGHPLGADEVVEPSEGDVWVIDGRPRYHLADCAIIQGQDAEPIPFEQATEDGFMPCSLCEPNIVRATA